uniref:Uncharacterized protein n=1 Tax=Globodera rostochiensis TaxID=31243 RepID=A0A914HI58_GLORO
MFRQVFNRRRKMQNLFEKLSRKDGSTVEKILVVKANLDQLHLSPSAEPDPEKGDNDETIDVEDNEEDDFE